MATLELVPLTEAEFQKPDAYVLFGTLRFGRMGPGDPTMALTSSAARRVFWVGAHPHMLAVQIKDNRLLVQQWGQTPLTHRAVEAFLGLHAPPLSVQGHPRLEALSLRHRGIHLSRTVTFGYDLIRTVLQQLIEWKDAASAWQRWVKRHGTPIDGRGGLVLPPTYSAIHRSLGLDFHTLGISRRRSQLICEIGRLGSRIERWAHEDRDRLRRRLRAIPQLGPWTIEHVLGFSLNAADAVPIGDYQLPHTVAWALREQPRSSDEEMLELLEPWSGHRWHVLRLLFAANVSAPRWGPRLNTGRPHRPR
ncbi:MAG: hypothetical protein VX589_18735 [Myxococcota bacterium]|nr:hypothetical protein [Myxococcota bacterium]